MSFEHEKISFALLVPVRSVIVREAFVSKLLLSQFDFVELSSSSCLTGNYVSAHLCLYRLK